MKKIKITELLDLLDVKNYSGSKNLVITEVLDLLNDSPQFESQLIWCNNKNLWRLNDLQAGSVLLSIESLAQVKNEKLNFIAVDKPRQAFKLVLEKYFMTARKTHSISTKASIHSSVIINQDNFIGDNVVIEENCIIGNNVSIGSNTVIYANTVIESNVTIGCNNTIGGVGFGYEKNSDNEWELMPHVGNVVIRENSEIGNNTCIDRAVIGSTVVGKNVKIDNLVHVAHGVKIDENSLIIAHAMLGGSASIGKNVWFGPGASVINKGVIHDEAFIGMAAVVVKPVEENTIVAGNPAKFLRMKDGAK